MDGHLGEDAPGPLQLVHQFDADAAAGRDEFDSPDRTAAHQPEVTVNITYWDAEEKVRYPVVDRTECPTTPPV